MSNESSPTLPPFSFDPSLSFLNCDERPSFAQGLPPRMQQKVAAIMHLLSRFDECRATMPADVIKRFDDGYKVLCKMSTHQSSGCGTPHHSQSHSSTIVPFVFMSALPLAVVLQVQAIHSAHRPLDETEFSASVPREPLEAMFKFVRQIDKEPHKFVFGFIYSAVDDDVAPVFAAYCGMNCCAPDTARRNREALERASQNTLLINLDQASSAAEKALQPSEKQQRLDATILSACMKMPNVEALLKRRLIDEKVRGRLLITMHENYSCSATYEPLNDELTAYLRSHTNPLDRTLEWIVGCDIDREMVATIKDDFSDSAPSRSYLMMQPWRVDECALGAALL